jgi:hypothetical protein
MKTIGEEDMDKYQIYDDRPIKDVLEIMQSSYKQSSGNSFSSFLNIFTVHHKQLVHFLKALAMITGAVYGVDKDIVLTRVGMMRLFDDYFQALLKTYRFKYYINQIGSFAAIEVFQNHIRGKYNGVDPFGEYVRSLGKTSGKPLVKFSLGFGGDILATDKCDVEVGGKVFFLTEEKKKEMIANMRDIELSLAKHLPSKASLSMEDLTATVLTKRRQIEYNIKRYLFLSLYVPKEFAAIEVGKLGYAKMKRKELEKLLRRG